MKNQTERLVVGGVALLIGLLAGWMVRGVGTYNSKAAMVSAYDDWRIACPAAETKDAWCELTTDIVDTQQRSTVARMVITTDKDGKQLVGFTLPHGVALEAGMGIQFGKEPPKVYQYRTCNTLGCIATTPYDEKLAASLKGADNDMKVMFATLEGKPVVEPVSLKGYSKALAAWKSNEAKRHSWFWRLWS
jgi:invasion protein IalB